MLAPVRLLAGVGTYVNSESAALDKALVAISPGTDVRSVIGVDSIMSDEVGLAIECLSSRWKTSVTAGELEAGPGASMEAITLVQGGQEQGNILLCCKPAPEARRSDTMVDGVSVESLGRGVAKVSSKTEDCAVVDARRRRSRREWCGMGYGVWVWVWCRSVCSEVRSGCKMVGWDVQDRAP